MEYRSHSDAASKDKNLIDFGFTSLGRSTAATAELAATRMRSTIKTSHFSDRHFHFFVFQQQISRHLTG
ncbi:hypothetical protein [Microcoleus sp. CAWBG24]|uniref:hypothetical protein n=1 Tax=Microcoleus sp. CAWBG24 TaxID=2841644 RepID=UPI0025F0E4BB|nr:hypothetical protein [Microcoleus sp. CAWBG24]